MIPYSKWIALPLQTRIKIAGELKLEKKGSTEVFNNEVIKDGYVMKEVEVALSLPSLQAYFSSIDTDVAFLFENLVRKVNGFPMSVKEKKPEPKPEATKPEVTKADVISITQISPEEQERMNKEYEARTGKVAPRPEPAENTVRGIDALAQNVEDKKTVPTLGQAIVDNKKKGGRPKGSKNKAKTNETETSK